MTQDPTQVAPLTAEELAEVAQWDDENVDGYCDAVRWRATVDAHAQEIERLTRAADMLHAAAKGARDGKIAAEAQVARQKEQIATLIQNAADAQDAKVRYRDALTQLEGWDMFTLHQAAEVNPHDPYNGWYGVATADAPWARRLIAQALGKPDPMSSRAALEGNPS